MKAIELAKQLKKLAEYDPDIEVGFAYPVGDYWHTTAVGSIESVRAESVDTTEDGYCSARLVDDPFAGLDEDEDPDLVEMVVLS